MPVIILRRPNYFRIVMVRVLNVLAVLALAAGVYLIVRIPKVMYRIVEEEVAVIGVSGNLKHAQIQSTFRGKPVTFIYQQAFKNTDSLVSVTIPGSIVSIDYQAFARCDNLETVTMEEGLKDIWAEAFADCPKLDGIVLPSTIRGVHEYAFSNDANLSEIVFPEGLKEIGDNAFYNCTSLQSLVFPVTITEIGDSAFENCTNLTSITFPEDGEDQNFRIYPNAFRNCTGLTEVRITDLCMAIGRGTFSGCANLESLTLPFVGFSRWINTQEGHFGYIFGSDSYEGGVIVSQMKNTTESQSWVIPEGLREVIIIDASKIVYGGFSNCTMLDTVSLNRTIYWIEANAFTGCTSLTIYSEAPDQPAGWVETWNASNRPVIYTGTE
jgi:hypothetical protein